MLCKGKAAPAQMTLIPQHLPVTGKGGSFASKILTILALAGLGQVIQSHLGSRFLPPVDNGKPFEARTSGLDGRYR